MLNSLNIRIITWLVFSLFSELFRVSTNLQTYFYSFPNVDKHLKRYFSKPKFTELGVSILIRKLFTNKGVFLT